MKPILFNTDMVRAILDGRKTVTRRVVKPQPVNVMTEEERRNRALSGADPYGFCVGTLDTELLKNSPYRLGDILYVRETWCWYYCWDCGMDLETGCGDETAKKFYNEEKAEWGCYGYKASFLPNEAPFDCWHPSIHMPKEAARLFLRVTDVRVERLTASFTAQGDTITALRDEGMNIGYHCYQCIENYGSPCCNDLDPDLEVDDCGEDENGGSECGMLDGIRSIFYRLWDSTIKKSDLPLYGWAANPWGWVITFERISREEAYHD